MIFWLYFIAKYKRMMMANSRLGIFCGVPGPKRSFVRSSRGEGGFGGLKNPSAHLVCGKKINEKR